MSTECRIRGATLTRARVPSRSGFLESIGIEANPTGSALARFLVVLALAVPAQGCTLIGLGIGAAVGEEDAHELPPWARRAAIVRKIGLVRGDRVRIRVFETTTVEGTFDRLEDDAIVLAGTEEGEPHRIPLSDISTIAVSNRGSAALKGALIGLGLDVAVTLTFVIVCSTHTCVETTPKHPLGEGAL